MELLRSEDTRRFEALGPTFNPNQLDRVFIDQFPPLRTLWKIGCVRLRIWLLVFGARVRFLSQSSTAIGLTAIIGVSAQRGLIWFLMYDWYAALVE